MVTRDPNKTKTKILAAATQVFAALGPAGARVDAIAEMAGVNKRMLYHYFGDKQGLYHATLAASMNEQNPSLKPSKEQARLLAWEGLAEASNGIASTPRFLNDPEGDSQVDAASAIEPLSEPKAKDDLESQMFALLQRALQVFPHVFGPEAQRVTGLAPGSEAFDAALSRLQSQVVRQLDPKSRSQVPKAKVTLRARSLPRRSP